MISTLILQLERQVCFQIKQVLSPRLCKHPQATILAAKKIKSIGVQQGIVAVIISKNKDHSGKIDSII